MYERTYEITKQMAKSHAMLNLAINRVVDGVNLSPTERDEMFADFCQKLEAHFKIEENGVFGFAVHTEAMTKLIRQLFDEHNQMRSMIEKIIIAMETAADTKLDEFLILMAKHTILENEVLYPSLDMELPPAQRDQVLAEIKSLL